MRELALFAGAGGGILGGRLLGWRTVCAVEIDPYARRVLLARQADGCLGRFPIWDDVRTFDGTRWRGTVDVISGGFPCQDISAAGKGAGITGTKSGLWKEMARIVGEVRPRFVFVENSPLLVSRGLALVLGDLAAMGYDARWGVLGAEHAGAPHKRHRLWIMAYSFSQRHGQVPAVVRPQNPGLGQRMRCDAEIVLLCTLGRVPLPAMKHRQTLYAPRTKHSAKPDLFYQQLEAEQTAGPKLDMFARVRRVGWDALGDEIDGSITIRETS